MTLRNEKVRKAMMREISQILLTEIQDTRISTLVSITDVVMAHDNSFAKIYFSILEENEDEKKKIFEALNSHKSQIRYHIGKRIRLRVTPDLRFYLDESFERGMKVLELIEKISKDEV